MGLAGAYLASSPLSAWGRMRGSMMGGRMMGDAMGCGGMSAGAAGVIDPPPGPVFKDPADLAGRSVKPGLMEMSLESKPASVSINGATVNLLTYNGSFPGPTIRVKRGMRLKVNFKSALPATHSRNLIGHERDMTNLHTHGFHVSPMGNSDNVMLHFMPGQEFVYEYDLTHQPAGSLCFYHPHVHGAVAEQYWSGMAGAIVVEDDTAALAGYGNRLLVLKDIDFVGSQPAPHFHHMDYMMGKEGQVVTVNGQVNPVLSIKPGEIQRWRVLNASNARFYKLSLEGHTLHVVGTDGGLLDKPYPVERILLAPGERVDLLVKAGATPGIYKLVSLPYARAHHCQTGGQLVTLMTVACEGSAVKADLPASINPAARKLKMDTAALPRQMISLSMGMGRGFMNGRTFGPDACSLYSRTGTHESGRWSTRAPWTTPSISMSIRPRSWPSTAATRSMHTFTAPSRDGKTPSSSRPWGA
jgi:FtsP/CotA-like multicopper oxidase with cupredoxin domain